MNEKIIFKTAVITSLVGLFILLILAEKVDLKPVESYQNIDETDSGKTVKLFGTITKLSLRDKTIFAELEAEKTEKISVIIFPESEIFLNQGDYIEVEGTVEEYLGKKEIIGNKITVKAKTKIK